MHEYLCFSGLASLGSSPPRDGSRLAGVFVCGASSPSLMVDCLAAGKTGRDFGGYHLVFRTDFQYGAHVTWSLFR